MITVKINDMPTARVSSSFFARGGRRRRDGGGDAAHRGSGGDDNDQRPAGDLQHACTELIHEDDDGWGDNPCDEQSGDAKAEDVAEQDLSTEQHEARLDIQLASEGGLDPGRRAHGVRDRQTDEQRPEGITEACRPDSTLLRERVRDHGQGKQRHEAGNLSACGATHHLNGNGREQGQRDPEHDHSPKLPGAERIPD